MNSVFERRLLGTAVFLTVWLASTLPCTAQASAENRLPIGPSRLALRTTDQRRKPTLNQATRLDSVPLIMKFSDDVPSAASHRLNLPDVGQAVQADSMTIQAEVNQEESNRESDPCENANRRVRAGCPLSLSRLASISDHGRYHGYYVGGGVPARGGIGFQGEPRFDNEGTWGMDYAPFYSRVASAWSHGRLFQGGIGQYEADQRNRPFGLTYGKHFGSKERR